MEILLHIPLMFKGYCYHINKYYIMAMSYVLWMEKKSYTKYLLS